MVPVDALPPRVVLVRPKSGGNIGSTARAMANFGLTDLRVVRGPEAIDAREAHNMAAGSRDILGAATWVESVGEAVAGATRVVACTARPRRWKTWDVLDPKPACEVLAERATAGEPVALMFGQEDHGLSQEDLAFATHLCSIPTSGSHSSLNLSQAVLLLGWEWSQVGGNPQRRGKARGGVVPLASIDTLNSAIDQIGDLLQHIGFFRRRPRPQTLAMLRHALLNTAITERDVQFLRGVVNKLTWWVYRAPPPSEGEGPL